MSDPLTWEQVTASLGMIPRDNWAHLWPEFTDQLDELYASRVAALPFVPSSWLSTVRAYAKAGTMLIPIPATIPSGAPREGMPTWLDDAAAAKAWDALSVEVNKALNTFVNGERERGAVEIARLQRNAAFWDTLYTAAVTVRDLPGKAVGAVLDGAQSVAGGIFGALFRSPLVLGALAIGLGFLAWRLGVIKLPKGK